MVKALPVEITAELAKDVMHIKHLFTINLVSATYYWTDGTDHIYYNGHWYEPKGISFESSILTLSSQVDSFSMSVANIDKAFSNLVLVEDIRGRPITVQRIFLDSNLDVIGAPATIFLGYIDVMDIDRKRAKVECYSHMIKWKTPTPKRQHSPTCPWAFKSAECGYTGIVVRNGTSDKLAEFTRSTGSLNYANVDDYLTDLTIGGTFTESSNDGAGHVVANAFDDSSATYWQSGATLPHWICCQFASAKTITQYSITPQTDGNSPCNFRLEGSTDGATWVVLDMQSGVWWPSTPLKRTFDVRLPGSYVYYRLWILNNFHPVDSASQIKEFELIGSATMVNDLDYNYTSNVLTKADIFGFEPIVLSSDAVISEVKVRVRAKQTDLAERDIQARIKVGGGYYDATSGAVTPAITYTNYDFTWATNPFSDAWGYQDFRVPLDKCDGVNRGDNLLHLNGENDSVNILDEYGHLWTPSGDAKLKIADKKFGSASAEFDGTADYIQSTEFTTLTGRFTLEGWFHTDNINTQTQGIIACINAGGLGLFLGYNVTGNKKLAFYVSSNGTSWNVAATECTKADYANDTWYKWVVDYDGATYRVYVGTVGALSLDISVASASQVCAITTIRLGSLAAASWPLDGGLDEVRITIGRNQYGASASAEAAEFAKEPPIFADSYNTTYYPSNAVDDNDSSYWLATSALPHWIVYWLDEPKIIKAFSITPLTANRGPKVFTFDGSNDGVTWSPISSLDVTDWVIGVKQFFGNSNEVAYKAYRFYIETNNGGTANYIEIAELGLYEATHVEGFGYFVPAIDPGHRVDVSECYLQITSDVTWCDYTHSRCTLLNNLLNYGGFRFMPELASKEFWWGAKQKIWTGGG